MVRFIQDGMLTAAIIQKRELFTYQGLRALYDMGVRGTFELGDFDVRLALYKNSEATYTTSASNVTAMTLREPACAGMRSSYQRTVARRPVSRGWRGCQPSSPASLEKSIA